MVNPSFRDLPGFSSSYLEFLEGMPEPGHIPPDHPDRGLLVSRCRSASSQAPGAAVSVLEWKEALTTSGGPLWSDNIEKLESRTGVVVGASAHAADFNASLIPLLKCLTAIKLAAELRYDGVPAVPLLWLDTPACVRVNGEKNHGRIEPQQAAGPQVGMTEINLTECFNKANTSSINKDLNSNDDHGLLRRLVDEFGLVLVDSGSIVLALKHRPELGDLWRRVISVWERESGGRAVDYGSGCDPVCDAVFLRLAVPAGAEVVGPEDYDQAVLVNRLVGSAGSTRPLLWPRVSATIIDRRSRRTMEKFKLELPDLLQGSVALSGRLGFDRSAWDVAVRLEGLAGNIGRRIDEICARAARDPRAVRRIRTSGSKMLYQLRKLAVRSRQFADAHRDIAVRQFEGLCGRVVPGGELQERRLSATRYLSMHPGSILQTLNRKIDVWDLKHQLIIGLD